MSTELDYGLHEISDVQVIAIDRKTLRRSFDKATSKSAIHMISAWATANHISLGLAVVDSKSNEITAIPKLLEILELEGSLVTIDAMGCQTEIAQKIVDREADDCLAVKGNQPKLNQGIEEFFKKHLEDDFKQVKVRRYETHEQEHGREDSRWYAICPVPKDLPDIDRWLNLKAIGVVIHNSTREGKDCTEVRYYILSKYLSGKNFGDAVRQHWTVENNLHWQLDVTFNKDQSRIRKGHADTNVSSLRRTALSMLENEKTAKVGIKNKRLQAGWGESYLEKVLLG